MLIDADSGDVIASENATERIAPASTTKIMTCLLALERGDLSSTVTVSEDASRVSGSSCDIVEGEQIRLEYLLGAMMTRSGNDAAVAVAEHIGGTRDNFVEMMNAKAQELGMNDTHFYNVHGKDPGDGGQHYTTVTDMSKLAIYAMQNPKFMEIVGQSSATLPADNKRPEESYNNSNRLVVEGRSEYYSAATGMKTGFTDDAGYCLVATASKNDMNLVVLLFGDRSRNGEGRWDDAKDLFEFGFNNYKTVDLQGLLEDAEPVQVKVQNHAANDPNGGVLEFAAPEPGEKYVTLPRDVVAGLQNGNDSLVAEPAFSSTLQAPILTGDVVGTVQYKSKSTGEVLFEDVLTATRDVLAAGTEPGVSGGTAVATQAPIIPEKLKTQRDNSAIWLWLLIPGGLIAFLVIRLMTVERRKRRRYGGRRKPRYSYKIRR